MAGLALLVPLLKVGAATPPAITSLNPSSVVAGGAAFTLIVNGSGFVSGATLQLGAVVLPTSFVNATQLSVSVPASLISAPASLLAQVANPGGMVSNLFGPFVVSSAGPAISSLNPSSIAAGYPFASLSLTVNGSGFGAGAVVQWNGAALATTFVSTTQLTASVPASLLKTPGAATVAVLSVGVVSNAVAFAITQGPSITSLSPSTATVGSGAFTLTINGAGFVSGSTVHMGNSALATTFVSPTQLSSLVPATLVSSVGNLLVQVVNPGTTAVSEIVTFTVTAPPKLSIITPSPLPPGTVGVPYSLALAATGGTTPYKSWTVVGGSLPPGLSFSSLSGVLDSILTGVPRSAGTFNFTVQVTDNANVTATSLFNLTILPPPPSIRTDGIVNSASFAGGGVAPGELVTIFGSGLGPGALAGMQLDNRGYVSSSLAGTQVLFDGSAAALVYASDGQVSAIVPYGVGGKSSTRAQVVYQGRASEEVTIPVLATLPGIFTADSSGHGPGAIVNQDGTVNSAANPAPAGSIVLLYGTGEGQTTPGGIDGKPNDNPAPIPVAQPIFVRVGDKDARVLYAGGVTGLLGGVLQVNIQIPLDQPAGDAVPIVLTIAGKASQPGVTLAVGPPRP